MILSNLPFVVLSFSLFSFSFSFSPFFLCDVFFISLFLNFSPLCSSTSTTSCTIRSYLLLFFCFKLKLLFTRAVKVLSAQIKTETIIIALNRRQLYHSVFMRRLGGLCLCLPDGKSTLGPQRAPEQPGLNSEGF